MSPTSSHRPGGPRTGRTGMLRQLAGAVRLALRPGAPGLADRGRAVPRLVRAVLTGRYRAVTPGHLGLLALGLAYVVSPVDLVPEGLLPLVGLADDAVVVAWLAAALVHDTEDFLRWERDGAPSDDDPAAAGGHDADHGSTGPRDRWGRPQDAHPGTHRGGHGTAYGAAGSTTLDGHVVR